MRKALPLSLFFLFISLSHIFSQNKSNVVDLTKSDFFSKIYNYEKNPDKWIYEGNKPCIIDFYADWCGPCKAFAPVLADAASKYNNQIYVYKINVDNERELAKNFHISSIPTLLIIPLGENPQMVRGKISKEDLEKIIDSILLKN